MKKIALVVAVALTVALAAGTALAWGGGPCGKDKDAKCSPFKEEMKRDLGITPEQDKLLEAQKAKQMEGCKALCEALKEKKGELRKAISQPGATREQVQPIVDQLKALEAQMVDERVDGIFAMKSILTPEQFAKLEAMKE
jgi:Spy/CpxP family protein refolding chaperone